MSVYMTEEEQLEAIKKWWHRYNTPILIVLSVFMLAVAGFRYYHWHQDQVFTNASSTYERMMVAFSNQDNPAVKSYAHHLIQQYQGTVYADVAKLLLAKRKIATHNVQQAQQYLVDVIKKSKVQVLRQIARTRLARLQLADKQYENALSTLSVSDDQAFAAIVAELQGDIYALKGERPKALEAYQKAMALTQANALPNLFLEMKTNELSST